MRRAIVVAALGLGLGCGPASPPPDHPQPPVPTTEIADSCASADDCTLVDACCGCNAGGKQLAIRKDAVAGFQASREQRCGNVMCAQMISNDPSCDAEAICGSHNRCRVAPHSQHQ
ncbi:MAG TPA: hypothetical protein VFT22_26985 [Kofleriaceae bacterium]|nr:hypothetical protein [Kofleriaceae bacterium]